MKKFERWKEPAFRVALAALAYARMVIVVLSLFALWFRDYPALVLAWLAYYVSSEMIGRVVQSPTQKDVQELTDVLKKYQEAYEEEKRNE